MELLGIPADWSELTPQWLTAALARDFPGAEVAGFEVLFADAGNNRRARLGLTYAAGEGPATVFLKAGDPVHMQTNARTGGVFFEHALFESGVALQIEHPAVHLSLVDEAAPDFLLLMEDVTGRGADPRDSTRPLTVEQTVAGVHELARLHSAFWGAVDDPALSWLVPFVPWPGMDGAVGRGLPRAGDVLPPALAGLSAQDLNDDLWTRAVRALAQGTPTLLHGDAHVGNTYVLPDGRVGFLDWQVMRWGNGAHDLGYFVQGALPVAERRKHERDLVAAYRDALDVPAGERPPFDELWTRYRASTWYGLAIWLATASGNFQLLDVSRALVERYGQAAVDLDAAAALTELGV